MPRPISPEEWDALSPRQRRVSGPRPTAEQYAARLAEAESAAAARAEIEHRIAPMLAVGGVEWHGANGAHRVYFDIFRIPRYDHRRGVVEGYYDVAADKFVSAGYRGLSDADFAAYIAGVIQRGGDLPAFQPVTYDALGYEIHEGDECVIVVPRDDSHQFSPPLDVRANVGRLVIAVQRVTGVDGLDAHWSVIAEDPPRPLIATGRNFDCEQSRLWMRSTSLMIVGPSGGRAQPPEPPAAGSDKKYVRKALAWIDNFRPVDVMSKKKAGREVDTPYGLVVIRKNVQRRKGASRETMYLFRDESRDLTLVGWGN